MEKTSGGKPKGYSALLMAVLLWALLPLMGKTAMNVLGPVTYAFLRGLTGLIVVIPFAKRSGFNFRKVFTRRAFFYGMIAFLLHTVIYQIGNNLCSANVTSMAVATQPIFFLIGGVLFLSEKLTIRKGVGSTLAAVGIFITCLGGTLIDENTHVIGILLVVGAHITWTIYSVYLKKFDADADNGEIVAYVLINGCILTFPFMIGEWVFFTGLPTFDTTTIIMILLGGPLALGAANLFWSYGVARIDSSITGLLANLAPLLGFVAAAIAGEVISGLQFFGCAIVVIGILTGVKEDLFTRQKKEE